MKICLILMVATVLSTECWSQKPEQKIAAPLTAGDLKQLCKAFELLGLELDQKRDVGWKEVNASSACVNFIMGVVSTIAGMDTGYYPQLKYELSDSKDQIPYKDLVAAFMKRVKEHPEDEKEGAAQVVALALMQSGFVKPAQWKKRELPSR